MQVQATAVNSEAQVMSGKETFLVTKSDISQALSNVTSLRCVETLLKAGLGCIAYLRYVVIAALPTD